MKLNEFTDLDDKIWIFTNMILTQLNSVGEIWFLYNKEAQALLVAIVGVFRYILNRSDQVRL